MTCSTCALNSLVIVLSCKKVKIPYLRLTRHEHLDSTCKEHLLIIITKCAVICSIYLVIHVLLTVKILYQTTAINCNLDKVLDLFLGKKSLKVEKRDTIVAAKHIDYTDLFIDHLLRPTSKIRTALLFHSIDKKSGKEEIICHVSCLGNSLICTLAIACMNLREKLNTVLISKFSNLLKYIPCIRLV